MDDVGVSPAAVAKGLIKFNPGYLTTLPGICKIVEFVSCTSFFFCPSQT